MKKIFLIVVLFTFSLVASSCDKPPFIKGEGPQTDIHQNDYNKGAINTMYETKEPLIADYIIDNSFADPTGILDSTQGIIDVLEFCSQNGGGTVFLPSGKYRVTRNIKIPSFVYLQGDYNDPESSNFNSKYGTIILADVPMATIVTKSPYVADQEDIYNNFPALFSLGGSAGVNGLTVYYPEQDVNNIIPYPFTFEIPSFAGVGGSINHMAPTIKNVTLINSYKGICASVTPAGDGYSAANEVLHLENIKGTALYQGMQLYNSSEYGLIRDIHFSSIYWALAEKFTNVEIDKIQNFTSTYGTGLLLGDLEWDTYTNITVENYSIGIHIVDGLRKYIPGQPEIYFIGQFYNLNARYCKTALRVKDLYPNMGVNITGGVLEGSVYAINDVYDGTSKIRLLGVEIKGAIKGDSIYESTGSNEYKFLKSNDKLPITTLQYPSSPKKVVYNVVTEYNANNLGTSDTSSHIQNALNNVGLLGGGIVYLPAGYYLISTPLTVPAGVELRGVASANTRDQITLSLGTMMLIDYGFESDESAAKNATSAITLAGDNAGISGIRFVYPNNPPLVNGSPSVKWHSYSVRATANGNYIKYSSFLGSSLGIEFKGNSNKKLENGYLIGVNGTFYYNGLNVDFVNDMYVEEFLSNASVLARHGLWTIFPQQFNKNNWPEDGPKMTKVYDEITRLNSIFMSFSNSSGNIGNSFTFGSNSMLHQTNSHLKIYNTAGDNLRLNGHLLKVDGGSLLAINIFRYQGIPLLISNNADVTILNRMSLHMNDDNDIISSVEIPIINLEGVDLDLDDIPKQYIYIKKVT